MNNKLQTKIKYLSFIFVLLTTLFSAQVNALQMNPLSVVLKPSGGGAKQSFRITNDSNQPIAVQFSVTTRQQINNKEVRKPADKDFMIYPPQTIIPARTTQKVRIEWLGAGNIPKEQAYRIIAEQVHVSLDSKKRSGITMLMTLVNGLYVQPKGVKSNVQVKSVQRQGNKLAVTLMNAGTKHQVLNYAKLFLKNGGKALTLQGNAMKGIVGNNLLAGATKRFYIPLPIGYDNGRWAAVIKYPR
jgi:fimbrial chaperone protein